MRFFAGFVLALAVWVASVRPASAEESCMSPKVGDAISNRIQAHAFDGVLPGGWVFDGVNVYGDRIVLRALDERAIPIVVTLRLKRDAQGLPDGTGKWFAFFVDPGDARLDAAERSALVRLATLVDAAVPEDEALRRCSPALAGDGWIQRGSLLPRIVALPIALLEVMIVAGGLVFARRRRRATAGADAGDFRTIEALALFAGALVAVHHLSGASATLWLDTINDQRDVTNCLTGSECTSLGEKTSIDAIYHAVAWLHFRTLGTLTGLGIDQFHWLLQALDAAGLVLIASAAARAGGKAMGVLAAIAYLLWTGAVANHLAVYNSYLLPFLGAVLVVVGIEAAERPGVGSITLTALVAAVMANVHAAAVAAGISVVWIALMAPRKKLVFAAIAALVFAAATLAIAPGSWIANLRHVASLARGSAHRPPHAPPTDRIESIISYGLLLALASVATWAVRRRARPRPMVIDVAGSVALPMLLASVAALATSAVAMNVKYLAHAAGAMAILCAAPIAPLVSWMRARGFALSPRLSAIDASLPYVAAIVIAAIGIAMPDRSTPSLTFNDLAELPRELEKRGWTYAKVYRSLKSPEDAIILESLEMLSPAYPVGPAGDDRTNAYVLQTPSERVPRPLPANWITLAHSGDRTTLLVFADGALDWMRFMACSATSGTGPCIPSGLTLPDGKKPQCTYCVPGMPSVMNHGPRRVELRIPLFSTAEGETRAITMPRWDKVCGGRILGITGRSASVSDDGRRATWVGSAGDATKAEVTLAWDLESPECLAPKYSGFPPLVIDGEAGTVKRLEDLGP